jgi:hypothetical protein
MMMMMMMKITDNSIALSPKVTTTTKMTLAVR